MTIRNFLFAFILLVINSCNKQNEDPKISEGDYIVFGHFYGFCVGEGCIEVFKLTADALYEDNSDTYPRWDRYYEGTYVELGEDKFELVKSLPESIPGQLMTSKETVFGSPDAADGGGIYFAIKRGEESSYWIIDQMDQNIPVYLRPFKDQINAYISLIND